MDKRSKRVLSAAKKIVNDHKNSNLYLEILEHFQEDDEEVVIACCDSAGKVFSHFIETTDFIDVDSSESSDKELSKDDKFHSWLQEQFTTTCDILYTHLDSSSVSIQISSLEALTSILGSLHSKNSQASGSKVTEVLQKILDLVLNSDKDRGRLISHLPGVIAASGEGGKTALACLTCLSEHLKQEQQRPEVKAFNTWYIVTQIARNFELENKAKSILNKIVLGFLKKEIPLKLYKEILTTIDSVMEKMTTPLLLADFLSQSFNIGGAISLMSLNGLFVLMSKYNLNYPDFYEKLYSLLQPQIFGAKYRARFFHLADTFLSSTHLPAYLVAAFIKRMARLSLHAPATGVQIVVPFILNLVQRHPACDVLLHRVEGPKDFSSDPYLEGETLAKCKALESCVWELRTLEHHFDPGTSVVAKKRKIKEEDISSLLERSVTEIIEAETKKKKRRKKDIALTYEKWTSFNLFGKIDL